MRRKCLLRDHHRGVRSLRGQDRRACLRSVSWHSVTGKGYSPLPKKKMSVLNLVNPRQNWPTPCKCTISVNTDIHKCLMSFCYHHCTAAEEYRSPGRYETLPYHRMPGFAWTTLHQLPWWSHSVLEVPDSVKKSFCQAYGGFNSAIPFWNRFWKQSLLHTVELVSSCTQ